MLIDVSLEIKAGMVFRPGSPPVELSKVKCFSEEEGEYSTTILSAPTHIGTHVDVVYGDRKVELERLIGTGKLIDVSGIKGTVTQKDLREAVDIDEKDFVFFRTGWERYFGSEKYFDHPQLSFDVIRWLVSKRVNMVGIDALGLGKLKNHGEFDKFLVKRNVYVIENLTNLKSINTRVFKVYCFPFKIEGSDALPTRIIVEI